MNSRQSQELEELNDMTLDLITDLSSIFSHQDEKGDLIAAEVWHKLLHREVIMERTIQHLLPYKQQIKAKDFDYFVNNCDYIFGGLPKDRVDYYRNIIVEQKRITTVHMNIIWDYLDSMTALAESYNSKKNPGG